MLNLNNYICALDIGSSKIAAALATIKKRSISNIFFEYLPSKGVKQGSIVDATELIGVITKLMKNLKAKSGIKNIKFIYTNISGKDIVTKHSRAIIPLLEKGNKVITTQDLEKVNEQARILGSNLEEEIIHYIPLGYSIDSKDDILNPLDLYSHKLEVKLYLISARLSHIQTLNRLVNQSGYQIKDLFFSGLATSSIAFDKELKEGVNLFCDIGCDITELLVFRNGILTDIEILCIGGEDFTTGLKNALKISPDLAEEIKRSYGIIDNLNQTQQEKEILIKKDNFYEPIKQRLISQTILNQAGLICSKIKNCLEEKVSWQEVNNFVIAGRTVLTESLIETLENTLGIQVKLARIKNPEILSLIKEDNALSGQKYLTYLTCLGILSEVLYGKSTETQPARVQTSQRLILKAFNRVKELYQEYF
jgi:cell division protein FtsA